MNFLEAVKLMKQGYICKTNNMLFKFNKSHTCPADEFLIKYPLTDWISYNGFSLNYIDANDWEVYKEPNTTLSDKLSAQSNKEIPLSKFIKDKYDRMSKEQLIQEIRKEHDIGMVRAIHLFKDVLKEYNEWLYEEPRSVMEICIKSKEIFGKKLIGDDE